MNLLSKTKPRNLDFDDDDTDRIIFLGTKGFRCVSFRFAVGGGDDGLVLCSWQRPRE